MNYKMKALKMVVMVAVAAAAMGGAVMVLWNWLVPGLVTGALPIDYPHALGLLLLGRLLAGGFGRHGRHHGGMRARWEQMSDEDRQKFRSGMRSCHGRGHAVEPPPSAAAV
jgi:hypothetical protein